MLSDDVFEPLSRRGSVKHGVHDRNIPQFSQAPQLRCADHVAGALFQLLHAATFRVSLDASPQNHLSPLHERAGNSPSHADSMLAADDTQLCSFFTGWGTASCRVVMGPRAV